MRRVVVTGMGVVSPLGRDIDDVWQNALHGRSAVGLLDQPFAERLSSPLAATARFDGSEHFDGPRLRMLDRVSQLGLVAARDALRMSACDLAGIEPQRAAVFMGTGMAGTQSNDEGYQALYGEHSDRIKPFTVLLGMHNAPAAWIALEHQIRGPSLTYSTACSASAVAIGEAWLRIAGGSLDLAVAGGAEAPLSFGSLKAWEALHTIAAVDPQDPATSCKPFSRNRTGMVLGEGAAVLVLEAREHAMARGAPVLGEVLGYGVCTDVGHITRPSVQGQADAMLAALRSSGLQPEQIGAINAHGTGTLANDAAETAAIRQVFGRHAAGIPISATKAVHGHLLGAAGALECVLSLLSLSRGAHLPTLHLREPDPACDLDYVAQSARTSNGVRYMLSNSFAFGGTNAVLALGA